MTTIDTWRNKILNILVWIRFNKFTHRYCYNLCSKPQSRNSVSKKRRIGITFSIPLGFILHPLLSFPNILIKCVQYRPWVKSDSFEFLKYVQTICMKNINYALKTYFVGAISVYVFIFQFIHHSRRKVWNSIYRFRQTINPFRTQLTCARCFGRTLADRKWIFSRRSRRFLSPVRFAPQNPKDEGLRSRNCRGRFASGSSCTRGWRQKGLGRRLNNNFERFRGVGAPGRGGWLGGSTPSPVIPSGLNWNSLRKTAPRPETKAAPSERVFPFHPRCALRIRSQKQPLPASRQPVKKKKKLLPKTIAFWRTSAV